MRFRRDLILNWSHYEEHVEEAGFQWWRWERMLTASDQTLPEAAEGEERLLARLDALVLGGERVAERLLKPALAADEPERISAAVFALLSGDGRGGAQAVREVLEDASPPTIMASQRGLEVLDRQFLPDWLTSLLPLNAAPLQALALNVLGAQAVAPGSPLVEWISSEEAPVAAAALRVAARLQTRVEWSVLRKAIASPAPSTRDGALITGLIAGHREAWRLCRELTLARGPELGLPLLLLALGTGADAASMLRRMLDEPRLRTDTLWALGFNGHVSAAETCLEFLDDEVVGPLAAEAFCAITGLELAGRFVVEATKTEALDSEGTGLPLPDVAAVRAWWGGARKQFNPAMRYFRGRPWAPAVLLNGLWTEPMRRRGSLALEMTLRSQGAFQLQTRAFARHQVMALGAMRGSPLLLNVRPLAEGLLG